MTAARRSSIPRPSGSGPTTSPMPPSKGARSRRAWTAPRPSSSSPSRSTTRPRSAAPSTSGGESTPWPPPLRAESTPSTADWAPLPPAPRPALTRSESLPSRRSRGANLSQHAQHRRVDVAVAGHDGRGIEIEGTAGEIADTTARFCQEQGAGRRIPGAEPQPPVPIEPARGDPGEVEHRRAHAPDAASAQAEGTILGEVRVGRLANPVGKARGEQALVEDRGPRDGERRAVDRGPRAALGHEQLVVAGIEHHAEGDARGFLQGDRHRPDGYAMGVVRGAVERIDDPAAARGAGAR